MHVLIDVQACQSESRFRGIGRSTLAMSRAMIRNAGEHRVSILINGMYPIDSINDVKMAYQDLLSEEDMFIFSAIAPTRYADVNNHARRKAAEIARDIAISNINPDIVFIPSYFEGLFDNFIVSISNNPVPWKTVCLIYDLIPLFNKEFYLPDQSRLEFYMNKLKECEQSDAIFTISNSAIQEIMEHTNIPVDRVFNISFAANEEFMVNEYSSEEVKNIKNRYNLPEEFIFTLAMIEPRKNIEALIYAYSLLPGELRERYPMVLAYKVRPVDLERIVGIAKRYGLPRDQLIFTGYIPDSDLVALYNLCKLFVFPSLHEGFGLPPLEAMRCGAAIIASNVTSLPEVLVWDEAMFDPYDAQDITRLMKKALTDNTFFAALKTNAINQSVKFSWEKTVTLALKEFQRLAEKKALISAIKNKENIVTRQNNEVRVIPALSDFDKKILAWAIARNKFQHHCRKLLVDISTLVRHDAKTGIQRVSRNILAELMKTEIADYSLTAVYYVPGECYRYANTFLNSHFGGNRGFDEPVLFSKGDIIVTTDLTAHLFPEMTYQIDNMRIAGATVCYLVYDLLPLKNPEWSDEGMQRIFPIWLSCLVKHADMLICISASVEQELRQWIAENSHVLKPNPLLKITHFHLGADIELNDQSIGLPDNAYEVLKKINEVPSFIMVGTIEPRKGHRQVLSAFEELWRIGKKYNLIIVGKQGWKVEKLCNEIGHHSQINKRLFWLQGISDEFLTRLYEKSSAMIFASLGEGFGLPLIEAARRKLPVIIRDISVFREIAQDNAFYFSGGSPVDIQKAIEEWLVLYQSGAHPRSEKMSWLTWKQSTESLLDKLPLINRSRKKEQVVDCV